MAGIGIGALRKGFILFIRVSGVISHHIIANWHRRNPQT